MGSIRWSDVIDDQALAEILDDAAVPFLPALASALEDEGSRRRAVPSAAELAAEFRGLNIKWSRWPWGLRLWYRLRRMKVSE